MISEKLNPMSPCLGTSKPVEEIWAAEISRLKSKTAASVKSGKHDVRTVPELASELGGGVGVSGQRLSNLAWYLTISAC